MAKEIGVRLGERIREKRLERGWRQIDLAHHAGLNENYISDLENAKKEACLRTLKSLASAFGISISQLLQGL
jgi:XRE family transcriptional regulator, regulator of sulfur utilization